MRNNKQRAPDHAVENLAKKLLEAKDETEMESILAGTPSALVSAVLERYEEMRRDRHVTFVRQHAQRLKLFEGLPKGTTYAEAVRIKAERGDPLARKIVEDQNRAQR